MREIIVDITNRCGMACRYCGTSASIGGNSHLDIRVARALFLSAAGARDVGFFLGGGTAFRHPHWTDIFASLRDSGCRAVVDCPLDSYVLSCMRDMPPMASNYRPSLSLWGMGELHNRLSGADSFKLFPDFMGALASWGIEPCISFVVTNEFLAEADGLNGFIADLPPSTEIYFHRLMPVGRAANASLPSQHSLQCFRDDLKSRFSGRSIHFHHTLDGAGCPAGRGRLFVNHDGNVYACGWISPHSLPIATVQPGVDVDVDELFRLGALSTFPCPLAGDSHNR